jgi:superfamily I DNA/RNA helicase
VEEVWQDIVAPALQASAQPVDRQDYETAIRHSRTRIALVTASEELRDIIEEPFAAWRVLLHPSQRKVAYRASYSGPAQVIGGPGTGKTVVALHRVKHLLGHLRAGDAAAEDGTTVRIGTMHSFKGLEFRCVAVIGVNEDALPYPKAVTPPELDAKQHETDMLSERCLLFVACTRARDSLYVSWSGKPSLFLVEAGV